MKKPLLLLDNESFLQVMHSGLFKLEEISFEEAKAIVDMHDTRAVKRCFSSVEISNLLYEHVNIPVRSFDYAEAEELLPEQDAIVFRLYTTPSETQPSIKTAYGNEATKIQNVYVYCQYVSRYDISLLNTENN